MNGQAGKEPFPEFVWPITDDLTCGTIDGYPEPEQFFAVTFDPGTQALLCSLLNGLPTARSDDGPVPAIATLDSLCMTFRHDFGWLDEGQKTEPGGSWPGSSNTTSNPWQGKSPGRTGWRGK